MNVGSASLAHFPAEVMADITFWLNATDLCHLFWTGSTRLTFVLKSGGVTEFHYVLDGTMPKEGIVRWPTLVHTFPKLRAISIVIKSPKNSFIAPVSDVRPDLLPETIEKIRFGFLNAESCFQRYPRDFQVSFPHQLPLAQRAELGNYTDSEETPEENQEDYADENNEILNFTDAKLRVKALVEKLSPPRPMRIYTQSDYVESAWNDSDLFNWSKVFPRLKRISLLGSSTWSEQEILNLHSGVEWLQLNSSSLMHLDHLQTRTHPVLAFAANPNHIYCNLSESVQPLIATPNLTTALHIRTVELSSGASWDQLPLLPPSVTSLTMFIPKDPQEDEPYESPKWPAALTSLSLTCDLLPLQWPPRLKDLHLSLQSRAKCSTIRALPSTLESVRLEDSSPVGNAWNHHRTLLLPSGLLSLTPIVDQYCVLKTPEGRVCTVDSIQSLTARFTRLESLNLPHWENLSDETLPHLPTTLTSLCASVIFKVPETNPTKFPAAPATSNLKSTAWPPKLKTLQLWHVKNVIPDGSFSESLPKTLTYLHISTAFKTCFFEKLPPNLLYLYAVGTFYNQPSPLLTALLPRNLVCLRSPPGTYDSSECVLLLPRTMVSADILFPCSLKGDVCRLLPPSLSLQTVYIECSLAFDLPPKRQRSATDLSDN